NPFRTREQRARDVLLTILCRRGQSKGIEPGRQDARSKTWRAAGPSPRGAPSASPARLPERREGNPRPGSAFRSFAGGLIRFLARRAQGNREPQEIAKPEVTSRPAFPWFL